MFWNCLANSPANGKFAKHPNNMKLDINTVASDLHVRPLSFNLTVIVDRLIYAIVLSRIFCVYRVMINGDVF